MRRIKVNLLNTEKTNQLLMEYFFVSKDNATNPENIMSEQTELWRCI
jgi:hypothetical protein